MNEPAGGGLIPRGRDAVAMRESVAAQRAEGKRVALRLESELAGKRQQLEDARKELEARFNAEMSALQAEMAPMRKKLAQLTEISETIDLYFGRDEQVELLLDGEPAPADEPLVIRQLVLAMDEESLILIEDGGMDARSTQAFLDWVIASPDNLNQVVPDRKGVVALVPTRQSRDYGDGWTQMQMDQANKEAHWLLRNGDRLYLLKTTLEIGNRLLPKRDEFVAFFNRPARFGQESAPMEPGSDEWFKAEEASDARRRHYMRIMLILQGLLDRSVVFHPLPAGGINLLSLSAQDEGKVRILNEIDNVLTSGREPFRQWQQRLNAQLRPGMRVLADFGSKGFRDCNENSRDSWGRHSRIAPDAASYPESLVPQVIEERGPRGSLIVRYARTDKVWVEGHRDDWGRWVDAHQKIPERRASVQLRAEDRFLLPFDLIQVAEMRTYLAARTERHDYIDMVPVLRAAIAAKDAETAQEAPFRAMLAGVIASERNVPVADVEAELASLVDWFKLTNRFHRPLIAPDAATQAKAVKLISAEFMARRKGITPSASVSGAVVAAARAIPGVIAVARRRDGKHIALVPSEPGETVYLDIHTLTAAGAVKSTQTWAQLHPRTRAAMAVLWSGDAWEDWDHNASPSEHLTGPERDRILDALRAAVPGTGAPIAATLQRTSSFGNRLSQVRLFAWAVDLPAGTKEAWRPGRDDDPGRGMVLVSTTWKRTTGGALELAEPTIAAGARWDRYSDGDLHTPYRAKGSKYKLQGYDEAALWVDQDQLAIVQGRQLEASRVSAANRAAAEGRWRRAVAIEGIVREAWVEAEAARAHGRFVTDFGADSDDLWQHHLATLRLDERFTQLARHGSSLVALIRDILDAGRMPTGGQMTVAGLIALHADAERLGKFAATFGDVEFELPDGQGAIDG